MVHINLGTIYILIMVAVDYAISYLPSDIRFDWFMVFSATFNNISIISWRSVLLVEEIGVPGENQRPVARN